MVLAVPWQDCDRIASYCMHIEKPSQTSSHASKPDSAKAQKLQTLKEGMLCKTVSPHCIDSMTHVVIRWLSNIGQILLTPAALFEYKGTVTGICTNASFLQLKSDSCMEHVLSQLQPVDGCSQASMFPHCMNVSVDIALRCVTSCLCSVCLLSQVTCPPATLAQIPGNHLESVP